LIDQEVEEVREAVGPFNPLNLTKTVLMVLTPGRTISWDRSKRGLLCTLGPFHSSILLLNSPFVPPVFRKQIFI
jgi:hypothetical protein